MPSAGDKVKATDISSIEDYTIRGGLCRLVAQAVQSFTHNVGGTIQFAAGSEEIDTNNWHDTAVNNSRITPNVAGYYLCWGGVSWGTRSDYQTLRCWIRTAVTNYATADLQGIPAVSAVFTSIVVPTIIPLNGSTDYVELLAQQNNGASAAQNTSLSSQYSSSFSVMFLRPL